MRYCIGLTLLEVLITVSIIALTLTLGVPSVLNAQKNMQLKGAVEVSYFALQKARSTAISNQADITVVFNATNPWCIALSDSGLCDCHIYENCSVEGVESAVKATDFKLIALQDVSFGGDDATNFDGVRGLSIGHAGSAVFSDGSNEVKLILSNMGRVRLCVKSGQLGAYKPC
ncbi:GspH/FimT family pseudopilin [Paraglaciecola sp.]|uniref:GspH/FimT family pseudopilin n=1 Tax=Paraglaciecola sp. TaxID=1920173 RepID=UPI00273FB00E|nr:GspH/FimT family pseudopilin [Paraglaciecola sp.]MDP5031470.1 prepilin peptidase dependent protein A [Paraglaciecola sp.]